MSADVWALMPDGRGNPHVRNNRCDAEGCRVVAIIDPEDREQVERLSALIDNQPINVEDVEATQAALREFADPKPPKPEVFEHIALQQRGEVAESLCGKVWRPTAHVTVVGRCAECAVAAGRWIA